MSAKYSCGPHSLPQVNPGNSCSNIWRAIFGIWPTVKENISWSLGNGDDVRFRKERWISLAYRVWKSNVMI